MGGGTGEKKKPQMHDLSYYGKCMVGGVLACGVTHAAVVSFDLCKCRSQAHAKSGLWPKGFFAGVKRILAEEGAAGLKTGWVPTLFGYGVQGLFKFGLNEFFKDVYTIAWGGLPDAKWQKMLLWAAASGSAEFFADIGLCPFEMTKVKMQVTLPSDPNFKTVPRKLFPALSYMAANKATTRYPFGSLQPLWMRQIPYTMIKFVGFYATSEWIYEQLGKRGIKSSDLSDAQKLTITFAAGYWAGVFCAIATEAADNLVSMKGNPEYQSKSFKECAEIMGIKNLFTRGLGTRIFMIGTLTGLQWWIYGAFKNACGFGTQ